MADLSRSWRDYSYVAFDTETSGAYPLGADIVEVGMVKWANGTEVDTYQTLLKPRFQMTDFIIGIHGITNEMVAQAPLMKDEIQNILNFMRGSVFMAHHAPFDMGFLAVDLERNKLPFPADPAICTSLLSRKMIPESGNHKLQTLIKHLNLPQGTAHRALDDARACLQVGLECMKRMGDAATLEQVIQKMGKKLEWNSYSLLANNNSTYQEIVKATELGKDLDIVYEGGSLKGKPRRIKPIGIVRNPDGDYIRATCYIDHAEKRFYIGRISDCQIVY